MNSVFSAANWLSATFCDLLIWPVRGLSPAWGLALVSIVVGVLLLIAYGKLSNQKRIASAKRAIFASLLEAVIFRHDLKLSLSAQARMFGWGFRYFLLAVPALIVLAIPCIMVMAELNLRYGLRPLHIEEKALVSLELHDPASLDTITLSLQEGLQSSPPLRIPSEQTVQFAIKSSAAGPAKISIKSSSFNIEKTVFTATPVNAIPAFNHTSFWKLILYPSADFSELPAQVKSLTVQYPTQDLSFLGFRLNWLWAFLLISIGSALAASKLLGIQV